MNEQHDEVQQHYDNCSCYKAGSRASLERVRANILACPWGTTSDGGIVVSRDAVMRKIDAELPTLVIRTLEDDVALHGPIEKVLR